MNFPDRYRRSQRPDYAWSTVTDAATALLTLTISSPDGVSGYYRARAHERRWRNRYGPVAAAFRSTSQSTAGSGIDTGRRCEGRSCRNSWLQTQAGGSPPSLRSRQRPCRWPADFRQTFAEPVQQRHADHVPPGQPGSGAKLVIYNVLGQPVRTLVDEAGGRGHLS